MKNIVRIAQHHYLWIGVAVALVLSALAFSFSITTGGERPTSPESSASQIGQCNQVCEAVGNSCLDMCFKQGALGSWDSLRLTNCQKNCQIDKNACQERCVPEGGGGAQKCSEPYESSVNGLCADCNQSLVTECLIDESCEGIMVSAEDGSCICSTQCTSGGGGGGGGGGFCTLRTNVNCDPNYPVNAICQPGVLCPNPGACIGTCTDKVSCEAMEFKWCR